MRKSVFNRVIISVLSVLIVLSILLVLLFYNALYKEYKLVESVKRSNENQISDILDFSIPKNYNPPAFNGVVVSTTEIDPALMRDTVNASIDFWKDLSGPSDLLKSKMEEYKEKEVWFRVVVKIWYIGEDQGYTTEDTLNYIKTLGSTEISDEKFFSDCYLTGYVTHLTHEMIDLISQVGNCQLMLAQYPRNPEHNSVITDTLSLKLDAMNATDTLEIVAVTVIDKSFRYATEQDIRLNKLYNADLFSEWQGNRASSFIEYSEGNGYHAIKFNYEIQEYVDSIVNRNNLKDKRVVSENLPFVGVPSIQTYYDALEIAERHIEYYDNNDGISAGFNAVLNKSEILKLSEDEDIRAIYIAKQND